MMEKNWINLNDDKKTLINLSKYSVITNKNYERGRQPTIFSILCDDNIELDYDTHMDRENDYKRIIEKLGV